MRYRNQIPPALLLSPDADKFVLVLDGLEQYKESIVEDSTRFYRPPVFTDLKWLRKKVEDLGYPPVPTDFPKEILDAMLLNAQNVMALKGSKLGLTYWLWTLTFGGITVDDSQFYPLGDYIIPSDLDFGFVSEVAPLTSDTLYLFSDAADFGVQILTIGIATKYVYMLTLRNYIHKHIKEFISFADDNTQINITFVPGTYQSLPDPYQYFVIP